MDLGGDKIQSLAAPLGRDSWFYLFFFFFEELQDIIPECSFYLPSYNSGALFT